MKKTKQKINSGDMKKTKQKNNTEDKKSNKKNFEREKEREYELLSTILKGESLVI